MRTKKIIQKLKPILFLVLATFIAQSAWADEILGFTLASSSAATSGVAINYPGQGRVINSSGTPSSGFTTQNGYTCYGWNSVGNDSWLTNAFSTVGYRYIAVVGQMKAANTGPRNFKAQYCFDGSSWVDVPEDPTYTDDDPRYCIANRVYRFQISPSFLLSE